MGSGYWILIADGFGSGLNLINPRVLTEGGRNWFSTGGETPSDEDIWHKHNLEQYAFSRIVR